MSPGVDAESIKERTGAIRHLDAARARELVAEFTRPAMADERGIGFDRDDPVTGPTRGCMTLARAPDQPGSPDVVGHYKTHLHLHGLERLPLSVARELARHRGHLYLDKLATITRAVAAELAEHVGGGLSFDALRRLPPAVARALGRHGGELSFKGVTRLEAAAALGLARHAHALHLDGLARLAPPAAAALSRHSGDLFLGGLPRLTGRVARHLARHRGQLHLHGLTELSAVAAAALGRRSGYLCLSRVRRLQPPQALGLSRHVGPLHLYSVEVTDEVAGCLGHHAGALLIRVPDEIPLHRLESLAQHRGPLGINGLRTLDERRARVLAAQPLLGGVAGLSGLFIDDVARVSPAVAGILAGHRAGGLSLGGVKVLAEDVATALVRHPILALDGVTSLTDRVAAILATHSGASLSLLGLEHASGVALARLRENPGIDLPRRLLGPAGDRARTAGSPRRAARP